MNDNGRTLLSASSTMYAPGTTGAGSTSAERTRGDKSAAASDKIFRAPPMMATTRERWDRRIEAGEERQESVQTFISAPQPPPIPMLEVGRFPSIALRLALGVSAITNLATSPQDTPGPSILSAHWRRSQCSILARARRTHCLRPRSFAWRWTSIVTTVLCSSV